MKRAITASTLMFAAFIPANASAQLSHSQTTAYGKAYAHVVMVYGKKAAGCKLIGPHSSCHQAATDARILASTEVLHRFFTPPPAPVMTHYAPATTHTYTHTYYHAPSSSTTTYQAPVTNRTYSGGGYCGAYQFDQQTWSSIGMSGSPCGASPAQQDAAAQKLYSQRGSEPWPNCGRYAPNWAEVRQCENSGSYAP